MSRDNRLTAGQIADAIIQLMEDQSDYVREVDDCTYAINIEDIAYYLDTNTKVIERNINAVAEVLEDMLAEIYEYVEVDTNSEFAYERHILIVAY